MNKRHYEHTLPNIRGSLSNTYDGPGGFLKESGATGYAQGGERCYGSLDNGVQNLLPGDFL